MGVRDKREGRGNEVEGGRDTEEGWDNDVELVL